MNNRLNPTYGVCRRTEITTTLLRRLGGLVLAGLGIAVVAMPAMAVQTISIGPSASVNPANILHAANFSGVHTNGFGVSTVGGTSTVDVTITNIPAGVTITPSTFGSLTPVDEATAASANYTIQVAVTNLAAGTYTLYVVASSTDTSITTRAQPFTISVTTNRTFWVATNNAANSWSTAANWSPQGPTGNDVVFEKMPVTIGSDTNYVSIGTNTITANTTIGRLTVLSASLGLWRTVLSSGVTLTVTNGFAVNSVNSDNSGGTGHIFYYAMTGGNLLVTNYSKDFSLNCVNSAASGTGSNPVYTFDFTGLTSLKAYVNRFSGNDITAITDGSIGSQNIRCFFPNNMVIVAKFVGDYTQDEFTNSVQFFNHGDSAYQNGQVFTNGFGTTTTIWADSFGVGRGRVNNAVNSIYPRAANCTLTMRNSDGVSRMSLVAVGVDSGNTSNNSGCRGNILYRNSNLDILADKLWVGRCRRYQTPNANSHIGGNVFFNGGTVNVNTAVLGYQVATNDNDCVGTINMTGTATLVVNDELTLGYSVGDYVVNGSYAANGYGQLFLTGSGTTARLNKVGVGGPSKVSNRNYIRIGAGTLVLTNTIGGPTDGNGRLDAFSMTNGTLVLHVNGLNPRIYTAALSSSGSPVISFAAITNIGAYPAQIPLISYTANTAAFTLGSLPSASPAYVGSIVTNTDNNSIDLLLTAGPAQPGPVTWTGATNNDWDILATLNWVNGVTPYFYGNGVPVRFDDSASTGNVNLTTSLSPSSITVSNSSLTYTFSGTGDLLRHRQPDQAGLRNPEDRQYRRQRFHGWPDHLRRHGADRRRGRQRFARCGKCAQQQRPGVQSHHQPDGGQQYIRHGLAGAKRQQHHHPVRRLQL